jgi:hypothetical protein
MEQRAGLSNIKRELARVQRDIDKIKVSIKAGFDLDELKPDWDAAVAKKKALTAQLESTYEPLPLLHPAMADVYRSKVEKLVAAPESGDEQGAAGEALRDFIDRIVIPEGDGLLQVVGNLGLMLVATNGKTDGEPPEWLRGRNLNLRPLGYENRPVLERARAPRIREYLDFGALKESTKTPLPVGDCRFCVAVA